jgi:hypothetical protein
LDIIVQRGLRVSSARRCWSVAMAMRRIILLGAVVLLAGIASAATAGQYYGPHGDTPYWPAHHAIYEMRNFIAYLEANPDADEGYKGPAITATHAEIKRLQAAIGPRPPKYFVPCCYSRRPIHIR